MKTKLFKLTFTLFFSLLFLGCCDNYKKQIEEIKYYLDEPFPFSSTEQLKFDFCKSQEAIIGENTHNTVTGISYFTLPIPRGSELTLVKKSKNKVEYECRGKIYSNDVIYINKTEPGLTRKEGDIVRVEITFKGFTEDRCSTDEIKTFQEKKKGSVIQGHPYNITKYIEE